MGHCSQIALGIALESDRNIYCLDGDGALIMHMGSLSIIGNSEATNYKHIVLNNGAHDSVGGQPTVGFEISIPKLAEANGYKYAVSVSTEQEFNEAFEHFVTEEGPALLEVRVRKGARKDLGRPDISPEENKQELMKFLKG
jgi:phosphonopyruvate decarboxylase